MCGLSSFFSGIREQDGVTGDFRALEQGGLQDNLQGLLRENENLFPAHDRSLELGKVFLSEPNGFGVEMIDDWI